MNNTCTNCGSTYEITNDDLAFLEKVSPTLNGKKELIPPPTFCPTCRVQRRMAWRNDRTFYHRKCDSTGKSFISMYPQDTKFPVYKQDEWHKDGWNALSHGRDFDFTRPFFEQWGELRNKVPHWGVGISNCENSEYCNYCTDEKNCYLDIAAEGNEDCYFNLFTKHSKNCLDCTFAYHCEQCYESIQCYDCHTCKYSIYLDGCNDCAFCFDCKGCSDCLLSINLRNQKYCILNEQHTKEEYEKKKQELNMHSYASLQKVFDIWKNMRIEKGVYRDMYNLNSENCIGNNIKNSKNCSFCFNATDCEDCKYLYDVLDAKDCQDMNYSLYDPETSYEVISTVGMKNSAFYMAGPYNSYCFYSTMLQSCNNCFGCVGLKRKEYCILNKQYTRKEYEELVSKIIDHMRATKEYGEFFPIQLSPHGYNETVAQEYMPLKKAEVEKRGWFWRDTESDETSYMGPKTEIPDNIADTDENICEQILICEESKKPFKIIAHELSFYKKHGIPLPHHSPAQRHKDRNDLRNPRSLWGRTCSECGKDMWTSYDPKRPEKIYCKECYLKTVY